MNIDTKRAVEELASVMPNVHASRHAAGSDNPLAHYHVHEEGEEDVDVAIFDDGMVVCSVALEGHNHDVEIEQLQCTSVDGVVAAARRMLTETGPNAIEAADAEAQDAADEDEHHYGHDLIIEREGAPDIVLSNTWTDAVPGVGDVVHCGEGAFAVERREFMVADGLLEAVHLACKAL